MICVKGAPWQQVVVSHLLSSQPCALCLACLLIHKGLSSQLGVCGPFSLLERGGSFLFLAASLWCQLRAVTSEGPSSLQPTQLESWPREAVRKQC